MQSFFCNLTTKNKKTKSNKELHYLQKKIFVALDRSSDSAKTMKNLRQFSNYYTNKRCNKVIRFNYCDKFINEVTTINLLVSNFERN